MNSTAHKQTYWELSQRPWLSLLFILPFLVVYEVGIQSPLAQRSFRNGADVWIRQLFEETGWYQEAFFPLLVPVILLGWHLWRRDRWDWHFETLSGMFAESLLCAMLLVLAGQLVHYLMPLEVAPAQVTLSGRVVAFVGAGIYEEVLFRLLMLPSLYVLLRLLLLRPRWAMIGSVCLSSIVFAAAHYVDSTASLMAPDKFFLAIGRVFAERELWYGFTFRLLAGITFSALFWMRGFGIAAGCHILYDLIVGVLLASVGQG